MNEPTNDHLAITEAEAIKTSGVATRIERLALAMEGMPDLTPKQIACIEDCAARQTALWLAQFLFSPVDHPDEDAQLQSEAWDNLAVEMRTILGAAVGGDVVASGERLARLLNLQAIAVKSAALPSGGTVRAFWGRCARVLNSVGMRFAAERFVKRSLYPKGCVGARDL